MNQQHIDAIIAGPVFAGATPDGARLLLSRGEVKQHQAGDLLIREGEASSFVMVVLAGKLQVFLDRQGQELNLLEAGPGLTLGEVGVLCGMARTASVRATTTADVLYWSESAFRSMLMGDVRLSQRIFSHLLRTLIESERSLIDSLLRSQGEQRA